MINNGQWGNTDIVQHLWECHSVLALVAWSFQLQENPRIRKLNVGLIPTEMVM
jgi:hypothetical protein